MQQASLPSLHSPLLPALLLVSVAAWPSFGAERTAADAWPAASAVLQRFITNQEKTGRWPWPLETIEIEASLPKLEKTGWLRAIRKVLPGEKPHYDFLEISGDRTVKNLVIARYNAKIVLHAVPLLAGAVSGYVPGSRQLADDLATLAVAFFDTRSVSTSN